jgi:hypothetical protein
VTPIEGPNLVQNNIRFRPVFGSARFCSKTARSLKACGMTLFRRRSSQTVVRGGLWCGSPANDLPHARAERLGAVPAICGALYSIAPSHSSFDRLVAIAIAVTS